MIGQRRIVLLVPGFDLWVRIVASKYQWITAKVSGFALSKAG